MISPSGADRLKRHGKARREASIAAARWLDPSFRRQQEPNANVKLRRIGPQRGQRHVKCSYCKLLNTRI
jgi:hypothetical protein